MDNPLNWYRVEYDYEQRQTRSASLYYSRSIRWRPRSIASNDAESAAAVARDELDAFLLVTQWIEAGMPPTNLCGATSWIPGRGIVSDTVLEDEWRREHGYAV